MPSESLYIAEEFKAVLDRNGFSPETVFIRPDIIAWRNLNDRQNCTWDLPTEVGASRLHVKRFFNHAAAAEAAGYRALGSHGIPTARLVAWGILQDHRSFLITEDLTAHQAADKLIDSEATFDRLLVPTADLTAALHNSNLHHRDLYLCHFFARIDKDEVNLRLIDAARVRPLPVLLRGRWLVKDLAQFWFSTLGLPITDCQRQAWLAHYAGKRGISRIDSLINTIEKKSAAIGAHDVNLRSRQPARNISIPDSPA